MNEVLVNVSGWSWYDVKLIKKCNAASYPGATLENPQLTQRSLGSQRIVYTSVWEWISHWVNSSRRWQEWQSQGCQKLHGSNFTMPQLWLWLIMIQTSVQPYGKII